MKTLLGFLLFPLATSVWADNYTEALEVQCDKYQMRVRDFDFADGQPSKVRNVGTTIYDDHLIVKDAPNHSCTEGTSEIGVMPGANAAYDLEICGYTSLSQRPTFNGCVRVSAVRLNLLKKPLNPRFPVGDLLKLVQY